MFDGEISHDQVSRHLRSGEFGSKELWTYVKSDVRRHEQKTGGVLLLDDTISEKVCISALVEHLLRFYSNG
jgi:hypothetical protein